MQTGLLSKLWLKVSGVTNGPDNPASGKQHFEDLAKENGEIKSDRTTAD